VPIAMAAFYERWLWITKIFFAGESRLSPRAVRLRPPAIGGFVEEDEHEQP
jgi:hypothetical protein